MIQRVRRQVRFNDISGSYFEPEDDEQFAPKRRRVPRHRLAVPVVVAQASSDGPTLRVQVPAFARGPQVAQNDVIPCASEDVAERSPDRPTLPVIVRVPPEARRTKNRTSAPAIAESSAMGVTPVAVASPSRWVIALAFLVGMAFASAAATWIHHAEGAASIRSHGSR